LRFTSSKTIIEYLLINIMPNTRYKKPGFGLVFAGKKLYSNRSESPFLPLGFGHEFTHMPS